MNRNGYNNGDVTDYLSNMLTRRSLPMEAVAHIEEAMEILNEDYIEKEMVLAERREEWSKRLGKYYKMESNKHTISENLFYVMPYKIIACNDTLWWLIVNSKSNYDGGVTDTNIEFSNIDDKCVVTEVTKEEFLEAAMESVRRVINRRLGKIELIHKHNDNDG